GSAHPPFRIAERRTQPVLPLGVHQQLLPATVSVDSAGEGEVRADVLLEGIWWLLAGSRWRSGEHQDQSAYADAGGHGALVDREPAAWETRDAGAGARE